MEKCEEENNMNKIVTWKKSNAKKKKVGKEKKWGLNWVQATFF